MRAHTHHPDPVSDPTEAGLFLGMKVMQSIEPHLLQAVIVVFSKNCSLWRAAEKLVVCP